MKYFFVSVFGALLLGANINVAMATLPSGGPYTLFSTCGAYGNAVAGSSDVYTINKPYITLVNGTSCPTGYYKITNTSDKTNLDTFACLSGLSASSVYRMADCFLYADPQLTYTDDDGVFVYGDVCEAD